MTTEYRINVKSSHYFGLDFLKSCIEVGKLGAELDEEQVRMTFPHSAVFFLTSDEKFESTPLVVYTPLSQLFSSEEDLNALGIDAFRVEMQKVGIKSRNRKDATNEYLTKFATVKEEKQEDEDTKPKARKNAKAKKEETVEEVKDTPVVAPEVVKTPESGTKE